MVGYKGLITRRKSVFSNIFNSLGKLNRFHISDIHKGFVANHFHSLGNDI